MQAAMIASARIDSVATLTETAAKLLLSWLLFGPGRSNLDDARRAGISEASYYRAVEKLDAWNPGWRDLRDTLSGSQRLSVALTSESDGSQRLSTALTTESPVLRGSMTAEVVPAPTRLDEPLSVRARAMQADLMDGSGDWKRGNDPCNVKRRAQVEVLQDAWAEHFPSKGELVAANAKAFLVAADNCCEDVLDAMEQAAGRSIEYPLGYIKKVLANTVQKPREAPAPVAASAGGGGGGYKPEPVDPGGLMEPSEDYKRRAAWIRSLPDPEADLWEV